MELNDLMVQSLASVMSVFPAIEFGKNRPVIGYDLNSTRIRDLKIGKDETLEVKKKNFLMRNIYPLQTIMKI